MSYLKSKALLAGVLTVLAGCSTPVLPEAYRGGPEAVDLGGEPMFTSFTKDEEQGGRWLAGDFLRNTDKTLADPVLTLQDFAQLEYTANQMKGVYVNMTPGMLGRLLQARDNIRVTMGVAPNTPVSQAVRDYASRSRGIGDNDKRLLADRRDNIRASLIQAGYAFQSYTDSLERQQRDSTPWMP